MIPGFNLMGNDSVEDSNVVYNAFFTEANVPGPAIRSDEDTLWSEAEEDRRPYCEYEFDVPQQQVQRFLQDPKIHTSLLATAARRARSEVRYATLNDGEKELFKQAKAKELSCWLETSAVRKILRHKISPNRIMTSRWILTWKPDATLPNGRKAKARLVVRGYQDPELDQVSTESPALSRDARMLLLQVISSSGWTVQNFDITTAFLRGKSDGRQLAMEPVAELKQLLNLSGDEVLLLEGNAYGRVDAPLLFYTEFRRQLEKVGFEAHPLDNCLFLLRNKKNPEVLDGVLGTHVDDGFGRWKRKTMKMHSKNCRRYFLLDRGNIESFVLLVWTLNSCLIIQSRLAKKNTSTRLNLFRYPNHAGQKRGPTR